MLVAAQMSVAADGARAAALVTACPLSQAAHLEPCSAAVELQIAGLQMSHVVSARGTGLVTNLCQKQGRNGLKLATLRRIFVDCLDTSR
ncbi:hypothetical protein EXIGLDRAFT_718069 [Exidia glandulosa HHB12029]|uniref:Uncharacterized protein n=1 Tax=Exidia glandulosa HHB12029 TaxID=1314781 RepID=A0A165I071_EXIGL|nr:hypothetical protein EXIGLDRAFT_718069 [Exidia glandulosa HHB12029]